MAAHHSVQQDLLELVTDTYGDHGGQPGLTDALDVFDYGDHDPDVHTTLNAFNDCPVCMARPVAHCGYVGADGCCEHDDNATPECHIGIRCPLLFLRD